MTTADLLGLYLVTCLGLTGLWNQLDEVPVWITAFLFTLTVWVVRDVPKTAVRVWVRPPGERRAILRGVGIGLAIWLPTLVYFSATYRQEFPFFGDHVHHVATAWNLLLFWREYFLLAVGLVAVGALAHWQWRIRAWPVSAIAVLIAVSMAFPLYPPLARYPTGFYSLAALAQWVREEITGGSVLNANRWVSVLSVPAWLFALRPFLLGLWPDLRVLPAALIIFFQKDVVYYASTTYLDVPALCLVLLGMEAAWRERRARPWLGVLICGLAAIFKEQAIFAVPVAWIVAYGWRPTRASLQTAIVAAAPFLVYWALRVRTMERPVEMAEWDRIFSISRLLLYAARLEAQFHLGGVAALLFFFGAVGAQALRKRAWRSPLAVSLAAVLVVELITFIDGPSLPWTGYPRYHCIPLGIAMLGGLMLGDEWSHTQPHRRRLTWLVASLAALQVLTLAPALRRQLRSDYHRNFVEHFDSPLFFPIRALVQDGETAGLLLPGKPPSRLAIQDPVQTPSYAGWIQVGYSEVERRYQLTVNQRDDRCGCFPDQPALLVPLVYRNSGVYRDIPAATWRGKDLTTCAEKVAQSCARTIRAFAPDGTLVGILGAGIR